MAELLRLGPPQRRNALQTGPGTTRGTNTVPKQSQMLLQLRTGERCDPALGRADPPRHEGKPAPASGLNKTALFLCLTEVTVPLLRTPFHPDVDISFGSLNPRRRCVQ